MPSLGMTGSVLGSGWPVSGTPHIKAPAAPAPESAPRPADTAGRTDTVYEIGDLSTAPGHTRRDRCGNSRRRMVEKVDGIEVVQPHKWQSRSYFSVLT
jgi:hypothetical protein